MILTVESIVVLVIWIIIVAMIFGLLIWLINYAASNAPTLSPFAGVARVLVVILGVLVLILVLLNFAGHLPLR